MNKLLCLDQVATILQVSERAVREMVESGDLRAFRIKRRELRVLASDLAVFLAACCTQELEPETQPRFDFEDTTETIDE
jgi:excisionase family DNA binding protein